MKHKFNRAATNGKGFTIIEVVLVLAIAGLIFLMVFIALPALQRSQRDTQRKDDLSRVQTAITRYTSNSRGELPDLSASSFTTNYLKAGGDQFVDPSGRDYDFNEDVSGEEAAGYDAEAETAVILWTQGGTCAGDGSRVEANSAATRKIALRVGLEGGGVACVNN